MKNHCASVSKECLEAETGMIHCMVMCLFVFLQAKALLAPQHFAVVLDKHEDGDVNVLADHRGRLRLAEEK